MEELLNFNATWRWPWPWIWPCGILSCIIHQPLPKHQISLELEKLLVDRWTYVRTSVWSDGHISRRRSWPN